MIHHSFVVRICAHPQGSWRGQVFHTASQQTTSFVELDTLVEFMRKQMDATLRNSSENAEMEFQPVLTTTNGCDAQA
jgi:hypothetical protein